MLKSFTIIAFVSGALLTSCKSSDSPFYEYMPDMYRSAAIEPNVDYGEVRERYDAKRANTISSKIPPFGSIPFYGTNSEEIMLMMPYHRKPALGMDLTHNHFGVLLASDYDSEYLAAANDINPIKLNELNAEDVINYGKSVYAKQCQHCHGEAGDGKGPMVESGAYSGVPNYKTLMIAEGQMFYSIYYGKGLMGSHGNTVSKKEIWSIIHYIKRLQDDNYGKFGASVEPEVTEVVEDAPAQ
jgi:mono/diheme cytochrome c family protein